jgi:hypothetical protein
VSLNRRLDGVFADWRLCPHGDADGCACRRPAGVGAFVWARDFFGWP